MVISVFGLSDLELWPVFLRFEISSHEISGGRFVRDGVVPMARHLPGGHLCGSRQFIRWHKRSSEG